MAAILRRYRFQSQRRSLVFIQERFSSVVCADVSQVAENEPNSLYPPIKPKYPPGQWGLMDPSYAWLWNQSWREESLSITEVDKRIAALCEKEMTQLSFKAKEGRPRSLPYKKYVTKTHVVDGLPEIYDIAFDNSVLDDLTSRIAPLTCDLIAMEKDQLQCRRFLKNFASKYHPHEEANLLLRTVITNLISHMSALFPHLLSMQYDEQVSVSAMWDRHGIERTRKRMIHPDRYTFNTVNDQRISAKTEADIVLRTDKPLPEFVSRDRVPSLGGQIEDLKFSPSVYGQMYDKKGTRSVEAGYIWGDPCEFGLLSVHNTVWTHYLATKYGPNYAQEARLAQGIGASFVWLVAQAYNQGFNTFIELTYPLTTQTILTDGQTWQFLAYQLNTLELWKDDSANNLVNICWLTEENKLFAEVVDGKVHGFNPDVLRQLIAFLALAPADRPYELRPTLPSSAVNPRERVEFIPTKKEEVRIIEEEKYVVE